MPKKEDPKNLGDYRPISLIHSFRKIRKIFFKALANRESRPICMSLFRKIKVLSLRVAKYKNFKYVLGTTKALASAKILRFMFKIDLAKAFDSFNWVFLLEMLSAIGCPRTWINRISTLLSMASTKILLNGVSGRRTCHGRGLR